MPKRYAREFRRAIAERLLTGERVSEVANETGVPALNAYKVAGVGDLTAVVVGGGIAGLASATGLLQAGWRVMVLERGAAFGEVGAGVAVTVNGMAALDALGVGEAVGSTGYRVRSAGFQDGHGRWLLQLPSLQPERANDLAGGDSSTATTRCSARRPPAVLNLSPALHNCCRARCAKRIACPCRLLHGRRR